jgi:hypothetical protein
MSTDPTLQHKMDAAFGNYLRLSRILQEDMNVLLDGENNTQQWRRNFIRASAALIEGHAHCLRDMCSVSFDCVAPEITKKESEVLQSETGFVANERIKLTLRVAYKLFELEPAPTFGGREWPRAQQVISKRHLLMHPKTPIDLEIPDDLWIEMREDVTWLFVQLFNFLSLLEEKHGG